MLPIMSNGKQPLKMTPIVVNILLFVPVLIIYSYQATSKGEDLTKGDKHAVVYLRQGWKDETCCEHYAPEGAQCKRSEELDILFHKVIVYVSFGACAKKSK
jgi:hypothetical protein